MWPWWPWWSKGPVRSKRSWWPWPIDAMQRSMIQSTLEQRNNQMNEWTNEWTIFRSSLFTKLENVLPIGVDFAWHLIQILWWTVDACRCRLIVIRCWSLVVIVVYCRLLVVIFGHWWRKIYHLATKELYWKKSIFVLHYLWLVSLYLKKVSKKLEIRINTFIAEYTWITFMLRDHTDHTPLVSVILQPSPART